MYKNSMPSVTLNIAVFWNVTPCSLVDVSEKPAALIFSLVIDELDATVLHHCLSCTTYFPTPIMEAAGCFKIPELIHRTTHPYIPGKSKFLLLIFFKIPVCNYPRTNVADNGVRPRVFGQEVSGSNA